VGRATTVWATVCFGASRRFAHHEGRGRTNDRDPSANPAIEAASCVMSKWQIVCPLAAILVAALVLAAWSARERQKTSIMSCSAQLRQIEGAKASWALEYGKVATEVPTWEDLFGPDKSIREIPTCPDGGIYRIGQAGERATCTLPGHTY
jgi:hypothetical protein